MVENIQRVSAFQRVQEHTGTIGAVERALAPKPTKTDSIELSAGTVWDQLVPTERAVRMVPAINSAFASLSHGDHRGRPHHQPRGRRA